MPKIIYVAAKLDAAEQARLLQQFPPEHGRHFGHHCTLVFKPKADHPVLERLGEELALVVTGHAKDERGQAVKVRGAPSDNPQPHITISCNLETQPVYSNQLLSGQPTDAVPEYVVRARIEAFLDNGKWARSRTELEAS